ncbi:MAG: SDR family NAD(P)-dependent oxidoreductase [Pseudomonadaceae bacterium]|nr:SDR family NAD(P)-dependent oxidoreductase [Pseudomonadaceae bacterium]
MARTALITGASAGLGVEFSRQLAAEGYDLILVARRAEKLAEVASQLQAEHDCQVQTISADLSLAGAPAEIEAQVTTDIDFLVNNAGSAGPHLLEDRDWQEQDAFLRLMMTSVAEMCHRFIPGMCERGFGRVINVSSFAGRITRAAGGNYGPSKAYLISLSQELALMTKGSGVAVSALCPGFTHTDFHSSGDLSEMKAGLPEFLWYDADVVVREGIAAVEKNKAVAISGRLYRWLDPIARSRLAAGLIKIANR